MQTLIYWLVYPFLWCISKLPWKLFYLFSDLICLIVYRILGYRKKVVTDNIRNAFPEKSEKEIASIRSKFYSHMCDMFLEMLKSITVKDAEIQKRYKFVNLQDFQKLEDANKSYMLLAGHHGNFEWANSIDLITKYTCVGVFKTIKNPRFNKLVKNIRSRFGAEVMPNKNVSKYAFSKERNPETRNKRLYGILADQTPKNTKNNHYFTFLGREVPIFVGAEILAKKLDLNYAFLKVKKVKRGFYEVEVKIISDDIKSLPNFKAAETYISMVEEQIREQPELYLWTHKRWKHAKN